MSVDCLSTSINVNHQVFKRFPTYAKNIVQLHKWKISPPEYLMVDIKCDGDPTTPANGVGWMIVYGIPGTYNDVPSSILDRAFSLTWGSMLMETTLDMNYLPLRNVPSPKGNSHAATKEYVDSSGLISMLENATAVFVDSYIQEHAECLYSVEREQKTEVIFSPARDISTLFDKTLSGLNALQNGASTRPKLSTAKNARRFFFNFDGDDRLISNVNLNAERGKRDAVHAFILFRLRTHNTGSHPQFRNGLFGHDNGGWDKFVCFHKTNHNLLIGGTVNNSDSAFSVSSDFKRFENKSKSKRIEQMVLPFSSLGRFGRSWTKFSLGEWKKAENFSSKTKIRSDSNGSWRSQCGRYCWFGWKHSTFYCLQKLGYV